MADEATVGAILDLVGRMPGQKRALLALMEAASVPRKGSEIDGELAERADLAVGFSVFGTVALRRLLEEAGALRYEPSEEERAVAEESAVSSDPSVSASVPEQAGEEVLQAAPVVEGRWEITDEGKEALKAAREGEQSAGFQLLESEEGRYRELYGQILLLCDGVARTAAEIEALTEGHPSTADPHRFGSYFTQRLEQCGALVWADGWSTTEFGRTVAQESGSSVADLESEGHDD